MNFEVGYNSILDKKNVEYEISSTNVLPFDLSSSTFSTSKNQPPNYSDYYNSVERKLLENDLYLEQLTINVKESRNIPGALVTKSEARALAGNEGKKYVLTSNVEPHVKMVRKTMSTIGDSLSMVEELKGKHINFIVYDDRKYVAGTKTGLYTSLDMLSGWERLTEDDWFTRSFSNYDCRCCIENPIQGLIGNELDNYQYFLGTNSGLFGLKTYDVDKQYWKKLCGDSFDELYINDLKFDSSGKRLFVATNNGLYSTDGVNCWLENGTTGYNVNDTCLLENAGLNRVLIGVDGEGIKQSNVGEYTKDIKILHTFDATSKDFENKVISVIQEFGGKLYFAINNFIYEYGKSTPIVTSDRQILSFVLLSNGEFYYIDSSGNVFHSNVQKTTAGNFKGMFKLSETSQTFYLYDSEHLYRYNTTSDTPVELGYNNGDAISGITLSIVNVHPVGGNDICVVSKDKVIFYTINEREERDEYTLVYDFTLGTVSSIKADNGTAYFTMNSGDYANKLYVFNPGQNTYYLCKIGDEQISASKILKVVYKSSRYYVLYKDAEGNDKFIVSEYNVNDKFSNCEVVPTPKDFTFLDNYFIWASSDNKLFYVPFTNMEDDSLKMEFDFNDDSILNITIVSIGNYAFVAIISKDDGNPNNIKIYKLGFKQNTKFLIVDEQRDEEFPVYENETDYTYLSTLTNIQEYKTENLNSSIVTTDTIYKTKENEIEEEEEESSESEIEEEEEGEEESPEEMNEDETVLSFYQVYHEVDGNFKTAFFDDDVSAKVNDVFYNGVFAVGSDNGFFVKDNDGDNRSDQILEGTEVKKISGGTYTMENEPENEPEPEPEPEPEEQGEDDEDEENLIVIPSARSLGQKMGNVIDHYGKIFVQNENGLSSSTVTREFNRPIESYSDVETCTPPVFGEETLIFGTNTGISSYVNNGEENQNFVQGLSSYGAKEIFPSSLSYAENEYSGFYVKTTDNKIVHIDNVFTDIPYLASESTQLTALEKLIEEPKHYDLFALSSSGNGEKYLSRMKVKNQKANVEYMFYSTSANVPIDFFEVLSAISPTSIHTTLSFGNEHYSEFDVSLNFYLDGNTKISSIVSGNVESYGLTCNSIDFLSSTYILSDFSEYDMSGEGIPSSLNEYYGLSILAMCDFTFPEDYEWNKDISSTNDYSYDLKTLFIPEEFGNIIIDHSPWFDQVSLVLSNDSLIPANHLFSYDGTLYVGNSNELLSVNFENGEYNVENVHSFDNIKKYFPTDISLFVIPETGNLSAVALSGMSDSEYTPFDGHYDEVVCDLYNGKIYGKTDSDNEFKEIENYSAVNDARIILPEDRLGDYVYSLYGSPVVFVHADDSLIVNERNEYYEMSSGLLKVQNADAIYFDQLETELSAKTGVVLLKDGDKWVAHLAKYDRGNITQVSTSFSWIFDDPIIDLLKYDENPEFYTLTENGLYWSALSTEDIATPMAVSELVYADVNGLNGFINRPNFNTRGNVSFVSNSGLKALGVTNINELEEIASDGSKKTSVSAIRVFERNGNPVVLFENNNNKGFLYELSSWDGASWSSVSSGNLITTDIYENFDLYSNNTALISSVTEPSYLGYIDGKLSISTKDELNTVAFLKNGTDSAIFGGKRGLYTKERIPASTDLSSDLSITMDNALTGNQKDYVDGIDDTNKSFTFNDAALLSDGTPLVSFSLTADDIPFNYLSSNIPSLSTQIANAAIHFVQDSLSNVYFTDLQKLYKYDAKQEKMFEVKTPDTFKLGLFDGNICKGKDGIIYFGSENNLVEFNGTETQRVFDNPSGEYEILQKKFYDSTVKTIYNLSDKDLLVGTENSAKFVKNLHLTLTPTDFTNRTILSGPINVIEMVERPVENGVETRYIYSSGREIYSSEDNISLQKETSIGSENLIVNSIYAPAGSTYGICTNEGLWLAEPGYILFDDLSQYNILKIKSLETTLLSQDINHHISTMHNNDSFLSALNEKCPAKLESVPNNFTSNNETGLYNEIHIIKNDVVESIEFNDVNSYIRASVKNWAVDMLNGSNIYSEPGFIDHFVDPIDGEEIDLSKIPYVYKKWNSGMKEFVIYVPTTLTYYINNPKGFTNSVYSDSIVPRKNVSASLETENTIYGNCTTLKLILNNDHFGIRNISSIQINGNSLPLRIYKDSIYCQSGRENLFDTVIQPSVVNSIPVLDNSVAVNNIENLKETMNLVLTFSIYGTDAQSIRIIGE